MYSSSLAVAVFAPDRRPEEENAFHVASRVGGSTPHSEASMEAGFFFPPGGRLGCLPRAGGRWWGQARARACSVCIASHACAGPPLLLFNCIVILFWRSPKGERVAVTVPMPAPAAAAAAAVAA